MKFMLDTDTCIYLINQHSGMRPKGEPKDSFVSVVVLGELERACLKSRHPQAIRIFISGIGISELPESAAETYARIRVDLELRGEIIGPNDLWIAAHALSLHVPLVTNNTREFSRVKDLEIENWMTG